MYLQLQNAGWDSTVTYVHYKYTFITNIHNFTIRQYKTKCPYYILHKSLDQSHYLGTPTCIAESHSIKNQFCEQFIVTAKYFHLEYFQW